MRHKPRPVRDDSGRDYGKVRTVGLFWTSTGVASEKQVERLSTKIDRQTEQIDRKIERLDRKVEELMALVSVEQSVLDAIGTELGTIGDAVQALIDDPGNPLEAADLTVITDPLASIQAKLAAPEVPVDAPHPDHTLPGDLPQ